MKLLAWHGLSKSQHTKLYNLLLPVSKRLLDIFPVRGNGGQVPEKHNLNNYHI